MLNVHFSIQGGDSRLELAFPSSDGELNIGQIPVLRLIPVL